jgi:hypothetical protein
MIRTSTSRHVAQRLAHHQGQLNFGEPGHPTKALWALILTRHYPASLSSKCKRLIESDNSGSGPLLHGRAPAFVQIQRSQPSRWRNLNQHSCSLLHDMLIRWILKSGVLKPVPGQQLPLPRSSDRLMSLSRRSGTGVTCHAPSHAELDCTAPAGMIPARGHRLPGANNRSPPLLFSCAGQAKAEKGGSGRVDLVGKKTPQSSAMPTKGAHYWRGCDMTLAKDIKASRHLKAPQRNDARSCWCGQERCRRDNYKTQIRPSCREAIP